MRCAGDGTRNKVTSWSDNFKMTSTKKAIEHGVMGLPKNREDEIYIYTTSLRMTRAMAVFSCVIVVTASTLLGILTAPPEDRGTEEMCAKVEVCNDNGACDANGECWCTLGMYAGDACEYVSVGGVFGAVLICLIFLYFVVMVSKWRSFHVKLKKLDSERKRGLWDLDKVESIKVEG